MDFAEGKLKREDQASDMQTRNCPRHGVLVAELSAQILGIGMMTTCMVLHETCRNPCGARSDSSFVESFAFCSYRTNAEASQVGSRQYVGAPRALLADTCGH